MLITVALWLLVADKNVGYSGDNCVPQAVLILEDTLLAVISLTLVASAVRGTALEGGYKSSYGFSSKNYLFTF